MALALAVAPVVWFGRNHPLWLLPVIAVLLIPGRLQAWLLRDLYVGRVQLANGDFRGAIARHERLLADLERRPALQYAMWLGRWTWTADLGAMSMNNLGCAHLELGELDAAHRWFSAALARDPEYAVPWFNEAVVATLQGDVQVAVHASSRARALGYTDGTEDRVTHEVQALWARFQAAAPAGDPATV
ncbi:MAG: tetratricopeptide repeat protein [Myxococcota bacterium]